MLDTYLESRTLDAYYNAFKLPLFPWLFPAIFISMYVAFVQRYAKEETDGRR